VVAVALTLAASAALAAEPSPAAAEPVPALAAPAPAPTAASAAPAVSEPGNPSGTIEIPATAGPSGNPGTPAGQLVPTAGNVVPPPAAQDASAAAPAPGTAAAAQSGSGLSQQMGSLFKTDKLKISGYWWLHYNKMAAFPLDETGARDGLDQYLEHRLRIRPRLALSPSVDLVANLDVLAGQLWGDTTKVAADELLMPRNRNSFTMRSALRELYVEWRSKGGVLKVGQSASNWGLGLVANDGEDREDNFGDTLYGDRTERVQFTFRPATWGTNQAWAKGLHISVAGDLVFWDDHANLVAGDRAWQFVGAAFWDGAAVPGTFNTFTGLYVAYRNQRYDDGDRLEATVVDLYTRNVVPLGSNGVKLILSGEGVVTTGHTNAVRFVERARDGVDLLQMGMVLRAELELPKVNLFPSFEIGLANGDRDSRDGKARAMVFDPDFQAGMILFRQVLGRMSAWAVSRAANRGLYSEYPKGYDQALTNGAITNALYVYPRLRWSPMKGLDLRLAFLWAQGLAPVVDPYGASIYNGGYPKSYRNGRPSKDLGWEIDGGISYRSPKFWGPFFAKLAVQFGWCQPGEAFADASGNKLGGIYQIRTQVELGF
jgi:hypothetical protein